MRVVIVSGVLLPPTKQTAYKHAQDKRTAIEHQCQEFVAAELDEKFAADLKGRPVLDNHQPDRPVGRVMRARLGPGGLVHVTLALQTDTDTGKDAIQKIRSGEYTGISAFHRFEIRQTPNGELVSQKSPIAEVSVCPTGRRPGTYITGISETPIDLEEAENKVVQMGEVFASADSIDTCALGETEHGKDISLASLNDTSDVLAADNQESLMSQPNNAAVASDPPAPGAETTSQPVPTDTSEPPINTPMGGGPSLGATEAGAVSHKTQVAQQQPVSVEGTLSAPPITENPETSPADNTAMPNMQEIVQWMKQEREERAKLSAECERLRADARLREETEARAKQEALEREQEETRNRVAAERASIQKHLHSLGQQEYANALNDLPEDKVGPLAKCLSEVASKHNRNEMERTRNEQALKEFYKMKGQIGPDTTSHTVTRPETPPPASMPVSAPSDPAPATTGTKRQDPDSERVERLDRQIELKCNGESSRESMGKVLKSALDKGEISYPQYMEKMESVVQSTSIPSSLQMSGAVAASADGGVQSIEHNKERLRFLEEQNPHAAPFNAPQLVGASWYDYNRPLWDDVASLLQLYKRGNHTSLLESDQINAGKRTRFAHQFSGN